jgi:hypothetical protein
MSKPEPPRRLLKRDLHRLAVARSDIGAAGDAATYLRDSKMGPQFRGYWALADAVVIAYGRPFTHNEPYGPLPGAYAKFDDEIMRRVHGELLEARNQLVAHSPAEQREVRIVPKGCVLTQGKPPIQDTTVMVRNAHLHPKRVARAVTLCEYQQRRISDAIDVLLAKLYEGRALPSRPFTVTLGDDE